MNLPKVVAGMYSTTWFMTINNKYTQNSDASYYMIKTKYIDKDGIKLCGLTCYKNSNQEHLTDALGFTLAETLLKLRQNINKLQCK